MLPARSRRLKQYLLVVSPFALDFCSIQTTKSSPESEVGIHPGLGAAGGCWCLMPRNLTYLAKTLNIENDQTNKFQTCTGKEELWDNKKLITEYTSWLMPIYVLGVGQTALGTTSFQNQLNHIGVESWTYHYHHYSIVCGPPKHFRFTHPADWNNNFSFLLKWSWRR